MTAKDLKWMFDFVGYTYTTKETAAMIKRLGPAQYTDFVSRVDEFLISELENTFLEGQCPKCGHPLGVEVKK